MGHDTEWCATTPSYDLYPKFGVCKGFGYNKLEELSSDKALSKGLLQVTRVLDVVIELQIESRSAPAHNEPGI